MADDFLRQLEAATTPAAKAALLAEFAVSNQIPALLPSVPALALLRWFTSPIVGALLAEEKPEAVESLFRQVIGLPFVERVTFGYAIHDLTRQGILERGESLPQAVLAHAAAAYAQMEDRHSRLEAIYCWVLAQRQQDALALWNQELLTAARTKDWSYLLALFSTVAEAEKICGSSVITYSAFHFMIRGITLAQLGDSAGAIADFDETIRLNPQYATAYYNRGIARGNTGDLAGAIADFDEAISLNPLYANAYNNRGLVKRTLGDLVGAIADYTKAISLNPQDAAIYNNRGLARHVSGDLAGAIADYTEAIHLDPQYAGAYNNRGLARHALGDLAGAADFNEAARLNPQYDKSELLHLPFGTGQPMAVETLETPVDVPDYAARFLDSIVRSIEIMLARLDFREETVPVAEDRKLALHILNFALTMETVWPLARDLLSRLAPKMEQAGHSDDWSPYLEQGIQQSLVHEDRFTEAELRLYLGKIHELRSRFEEADAEFAASAACYAELGQSRKQALALICRSRVARLQRRYESAKQWVHEAMSLLPDDAPEWADCYFTQGVIAFDHRQWREAVDAFGRSLALWEAQNNKHMIALSLRNLGPALHLLREYDAAIHIYERALAIFDEVPDPVNQAVTRMNLGIVYSLQGERERALALYQQAEPVFRRVQDELNMARIYTNLGIEYRKLGQWMAAESANRQAIALWQKLNNLRSELNVMDELGMTYLDQGLTAEAIAVFEEALARLERIDGTPGADRLRTILTADLARAR